MTSIVTPTIALSPLSRWNDLNLPVLFDMAPPSLESAWFEQDCWVAGLMGAGQNVRSEAAGAKMSSWRQARIP
jgi:hypothetical protein